MNAGLWALSAARKGRKKPIVPGTSAFILEETAANLRVTKDTINGLNSSLESSVVGLNSIIDSINNGASYEELETQIQHYQPAPESPIEDSFRASSVLNRSDWDSAVNSSRPELLLQNSERVGASSVSPASAPPLLSSDESHDSQILKTQQGRPLLTSKNKDHPSQINNPHEASSISNMDLEPNIHVKLEHVSRDRTLPQEDKSESIAPLSELPIKNAEPGLHSDHKAFHRSTSKVSPPIPQAELLSEKSSQKISSVPHGNTTSESISDPNSLSPIKLVNGRVAPLTSPNVDLSFIPIANTINPGNHTYYDKGKEEVESNESEDDLDNSFQAISTAIRKSFAGKTSMGQNSAPTSMHDDTQNEAEVTKPVVSRSNQHWPSEKAGSHSLEQESIKVKMEHEADSVKSPSRTKPRNSRSRSFNSSRYTTSLFVSLPKKESIALHPANTARSEKPAFRSEKENQSSDLDLHEQQQSMQASFEASAVPKSMMAAKPTQVSKETSVIQSNSTSTQEVPTLFSGKTFSKAFPPSEPSSITSIATPKLSPNTATSKRISGRFGNRTTTAGSPVRRTPGTRPLPMRRSPMKSRTSGSSSAIPLSSSVNSSRSPTKYSHRNDPASLRGSPTMFSIHETENRRKRSLNKSSPSQLHSTSKHEKSAKSVSSERDFLTNRFLTTALLPDNSKRQQPSFRSDNYQASLARASRDSQSGISKLKQAGSVARNFIPSLQPDANPKPKITLSLHSKQDLKRARDSYRIPNRAVTSPEKRDRSKMVKLQTTVTKGMKPLPNPSSTQILPRKRALGNAIPLPDEARGKIRKDSTKRIHASETIELKTPTKTSSIRKKYPASTKNSSSTLPHTLPDIPSDDEVLRSTKYIESWAETPEILRATNENKRLDPDAVFGECSLVDMNDIFGK